MIELIIGIVLGLFVIGTILYFYTPAGKGLVTMLENMGDSKDESK